MRPSARARILVTAALAAMCLYPPGAHAQCPKNNMSIGSPNVAASPNNPFQAERVSDWKGTPLNSPFRSSAQRVARDSAGRLRIESFAGEFDILAGNDAGTKEAKHLIFICDPVQHQRIILDTLNKTAEIDGFPARTGLPMSGAPQPFCQLPPALGKSNHVQVEPLGTQVIEGFEAVGYRIIRQSLVAGNAPSSSDLWCSEDLGAVLLDVDTSSNGRVTHQIKLDKVERREPDPSLFQIPGGYQVNQRVHDPKHAAPPGTSSNFNPPAPAPAKP